LDALVSHRRTLKQAFTPELCLSSGDSESAGKGILSAVMNRITGNADKASDAPAASNGTEAKQNEDAQKKSVPELQASLPHVATRHVPTLTTADDSHLMPVYEEACAKTQHISFAVFAFCHTSFMSTGSSILCKYIFCLVFAQYCKHEVSPRCTAYQMSA